MAGSNGVMPQIGREATVHALGKTWTVGRFTMEVWDDLIRWAADRIPNQLEALRPIIRDVPPEMAMQLIRDAQAKTPDVLTIGHPLLQKAIEETPEGQIHRWYLLLRQKHPDVTKDTALEILMELGQAKIEETLAQVAGQPPPEKKDLAPAA